MLFATPDSWFGFYFTILCIVLYILTGQVLDFFFVPRWCGLKFSLFTHGAVEINIKYLGIFSDKVLVWFLPSETTCTLMHF